jgi:uncharacterized protein YegL
MKDNYVYNEDLIVNPSHRLPVCIVLDTSTSMQKVVGGTYRETGRIEYRDGQQWQIVEGGTTILEGMVDGINKFYDAVKKDVEARFSCEIAIVTFDDDARVVEDFSTIDNKKTFICPNVGDDTYMAKGVEIAINLLAERKKDYQKNGVDYFQPWLLLFTDGDPTDSVVSIQNKTMELESKKKLTIFTFSLDDKVNMNTLAGFSSKRPIRIKDGKFEEFFAWLGRSVGTTSRSNPGDKVKLDTTALDDWAQL